MQTFPGLKPIIDHYDAVLLDLWGCLHDGTALYPGALEALEALHTEKKRVVFLSNAPRRAVKAQVVLDQLGVPRNLYEAIVTSGEVGFQLLKNSTLNLGKRYTYLGPEHDADVLQGLPLTATPDLSEANFLLNVGFGSEGEGDSSDDLLREAAALNLHMLCLNPDLIVVKQTGERFLCAGALAADYEKIGGHVTYIGKPYTAVYDYALKLLGSPPVETVLAIGDSVETDIAGANRAGIASALVTSGILKQELDGKPRDPALQQFFNDQEVTPTYVLPGLMW